MSEERPPPDSPEHIDPEDAGFDDGLCALCGRPTVRPFVEWVELARGEEYKEPFVCNKCLVDLRGDMATELEVRRQMGNLQAELRGLQASKFQKPKFMPPNCLSGLRLLSRSGSNLRGLHLARLID